MKRTDGNSQPNHSSFSRRHVVFLVLIAGVLAAGIAFVLTRNASSPPQPHRKAPAVSDMAAQCIAKLPLDIKLGQKLMLSATTATLADASSVAAEHYMGGVILMDEASGTAVKAYVAAQPLPPLVATDQEGGTVQRYQSEGALPAAADVPANYSPAQINSRIAADAAYLKSQGINMNLAPVADVAPAAGAGVLGSRTFGSDPGTVATYARAYIQADLSHGVLPTLKHFPGLGSASRNTDDGPATTPSFAQLQRRDIVPYQQLAGTAAAVMVGNQTVPGLTDGLPASLSRQAVTAELRNILAYKDNVVITDSLSAKAITNQYSITTAVVKAWEAGDDIALVVQTDPATVMTSPQVDQIIAAGKQAVQDGQLSQSAVNASLARLFALSQKHVDACHIPAQRP